MANPEIEGLTDWRPLARGGFATVWEARQESLNRMVAVKVDQRKLDNPGERERFLREAGAAGRMSGHPGIVTVHDAGLLPDDRPYLVMELCTGGSLTRRLDPANRPTPAWVREVGVRIADALAAAHAQGVLHRDVKPANVLIDQYGHAGLADFGLAVMPDPDMELAETLEALTPAYAPPEAFNPHSPTERGDVYSLAATLYALLSGHPPRSPDNDKPDVTTALERLGQPIDRVPGVDDGLMDVLLLGMSDDPTERPSAVEFRDALEAVDLEHAEPVPLVVLEPETVPAVPVRRGSRRLGVLVAALALVLVAVAVGLTFGPRTGGAVVPPATTPSSSPSVAPTTASPTPSATPTPSGLVGFDDCTAELGAGVLCGPTPPECWGSLPSAFDAPVLASPASCNRNHIYQTFAAGPLDFVVRRQSQLDEDKGVQRTCTAEVVNSMLAAKDRRDDWEIYAIPPQGSADANYFRCVFGRGERSSPLELTKPS